MSFLQNFGTTEVVVIAIVLLLLFGGRKIPEFVRGIADAIKEVKKGSDKE